MNEKILKDFPSIHQVRYRGATVASPVLAISIAELQQAARVPTSRCPYPWLQCCCYMQTRVHDRQPTTHELDYVRAQRILPKPYIPTDLFQCRGSRGNSTVIIIFYILLV